MRNKHFVLPLLLIFFFISSLPVQANPTCPWVLSTGEQLITGFLTKIEGDHIYVQTAQKQNKLQLLSEPTVAIMGTHSGYILPISKFPHNVKADFFITAENKVRAIRNHYEPFKEVPGSPLQGYGHNALLSPNNNYYLLFNYHTGLFLHSIENKVAPLYLSSSPTATWSHTGKEIAYISDNKLVVYHLDLKDKTQHILSMNEGSNTDKSTDIDIPQEIHTTYTNLAWSQEGKYLLCTALQDYPNVGSNVFQNIVVNKEGQTIAKKTFSNQSKALWLSEDSILFIILSDPEGSSSKGIVWNIKTDSSTELLPSNKKGYQNAVINKENKLLAYTTARGIGEDLYLLDTSNGYKHKIYSFITPIRNLQWSSHSTLFFWDEFNNTIYELRFSSDYRAPILTPKAAGYLPEHAVGTRFIYFLAEPFEEPLQPIMP